MSSANVFCVFGSVNSTCHLPLGLDLTSGLFRVT